MAAAQPAALPDRPLPNASQEARAEKLFQEVRCVVCQHESIADSPAGLAGDMRRLVREQVAAGRTDDEIRRDLVRRYGDFVLFTPPFNPATLLLWLGPFLLLAGAAAAFWRWSRRARAEVQPLTAEEEAMLDQRLQTDIQRHGSASAVPNGERESGDSSS